MARTYLRRLVKESVASAALYLGANMAFRACLHRRLLILCYHGVVEDAQAQNPVKNRNAIGITEFKRQMIELKRLFVPIRASDLRDWQKGNALMPNNAALVTFDDGYRNNLTRAAPVLRSLGIPALINISVGYIGQQRILWPDEIYRRVAFWPHRFIPLPAGRGQKPIPVALSERLALAGYLRESCKRLSQEQLTCYLTELREAKVPECNNEVFGFLSWEEVRTLKQMGFEIGSHTVNHPILTKLRWEELDRELTNSKRSIEDQTECECSYFAYPNGGPDDVLPEVVERIRSAGYSFAFTVMNRRASADDDPLLLDRVYIPGGISMADFRSRISGFHGVLKRVVGSLRQSVLTGTGRMRLSLPDDATGVPQ